MSRRAQNNMKNNGRVSPGKEKTGTGAGTRRLLHSRAEETLLKESAPADSETRQDMAITNYS